MQIIMNLSLFLLLSINSNGFVPTSNNSKRISPFLLKLQNGKNSNAETKPIDNVITDLHKSGYPFRIVVVGNGAILETTSKLGPVMKSSISPKTGGKLVTLASDDQSFEFHVKVDEVSKIVFVETAKPSDDGEKVLRICRFMNKEGGSICSLILNEAGEEAVQWFGGMQKRYGDC